MKKPSWFRLIDFLSIAGLGILSGGITIYAMTQHATGPKGWQALCWVVTGTFLAIWARFAYARKQWLDTFRWYPKHGFMVQYEQLTPYTDAVLDATIEHAIAAWTPYFPAQKMIEAEVTWVWFKKGLDETALNPAHKKVNGVTLYGSHLIEVDYDTFADDIDKTAFEHELGHVIMGNATGQWDNDTHHAFAREHHLK
jgi:hypothetical protein